MINNTLVEYDPQNVTEMQCRLFCAHYYGLSDWDCFEFSSKLQNARRKYVLSQFAFSEYYFFWSFRKFLLFVFSPKLFRKISKHKYVRIIKQKVKSNRKSHKTSSTVFRNLMEYKNNVEQLLVSAVVLWYEKF